jgi:hypothetical protein
MSRAYRIRVRETLERDISAEDRITSHLELLEILPPEQMAELLRNELKGKGFEDKGGKLVRQDGDITVTVDPTTGEVTVSSEATEHLAIEGQREGQSYDDVGPGAENMKRRLEGELKQDLENRAAQQQQRLQGKASEALEGHLCDLHTELDGVVNRVTAEALKQKAAQMGEIKEISEDPQSGSLTITLEV